MVFNDTTNTYNSLYHSAARRLRMESNISVAFPLDEFTEYANRAYERASYLINISDGAWQQDDLNYTDHPIALTDLVNEQQRYQLDMGSAFTDAERVEGIAAILAKQENGKWIHLSQVDKQDGIAGVTTASGYHNTEVRSETWLERLENAAVPGQLVTGTPRVFNVQADFFDVYPLPDYSQVEGFKIYYERGVSYFISTDTTKEPGFAKSLHSYIAVYAALEKASVNTLPQLGYLAERTQLMEQQIQDFYGRRNKGRRKNLSATNYIHV